MKLSHVIRVKSFSDRFDIIEDVGKGTYGEVHKCRDKVTGEIVATKKVFFLRKEEGLPINTVREGSILFNLKHENIVELKAVVQTEENSQEGTYLVFEYCKYDLYALLYTPDVEQINVRLMKALMKQFMVSLHFCAINKVVHRDLKPANMFITEKNILKLGDFGLSRKIDLLGKYSAKVITQWYRPPELLLGCNEYGQEIDIWSAGCILYEMATAKILFHSKRSDDELSQLAIIFDICGIPSDDVLSKYSEYPNHSLIDKFRFTQRYSSLPRIFERMDQSNYSGLSDLLMKMLQYDPRKRITAEQALNHEFFRKIDSSYDPLNIPPLEREEMHQKTASEKKNEKKKLEMAIANRPENK